MFTGYLVYNTYLFTPKFIDIYNLLINSFNDIGLDIVAISSRDMILKLGKDRDFIIFYDKDIYLANLLESKGYKVYNSPDSIAICDDKLLTYTTLFGKVDMPFTTFAPKRFTSIKESYKDLYASDVDIFKDELSIAASIGYPLVVKEVFGSFGNGVYLINDEFHLIQLLKKLDKTPYLFQEYIKTSYGQDVRIYVAGGKAIFSVLRTSNNDFRANCTLGGSMQLYKASESQNALAVKACDEIGLTFAGVDILFGTNGNPVLCEINSNSHFRNALNATAINFADYIAKACLEDLSNN